MHYCLAKILEGQARLGGRIVMLECKNYPGLMKLYKKFGFQVIEKDYDANELIQMIKVLNDTDIINSH